ncbi:ribonuclease H-like domain-containing protein [Aquifex sp.]
MEVVILDIETYGHEENLSYKDFNYLKTRKGLESDEEVLEELSLNPFLSYVISAAYIKLPNGEPLEGENLKINVIYLTEEEGFKREEFITYMGRTYRVVYYPITFNELRHDHIKDKEKELLEKFFEDIDGDLYLVSYNGKYFDIPFLRIRAMIHGIDFPAIFEDRDKHIDIVELLFRGRSYQFSKYSFDFIARHFGLKTPKERFDGKEVKNLFIAERYDTIAKYNASDVLVLYHLYKKLRKYIPHTPSPPTENQIKMFYVLLKEIGYLIQNNYSSKNIPLDLCSDISKDAMSTTISVLKQFKSKLQNA